MVYTFLPMHKEPVPVVLENIGSCLIPIEDITGTIVNRRCYLKRFIGWQKNPSKFKYFAEPSHVALAVSHSAGLASSHSAGLAVSYCVS